MQWKKFIETYNYGYNILPYRNSKGPQELKLNSDTYYVWDNNYKKIFTGHIPIINIFFIS